MDEPHIATTPAIPAVDENENKNELKSNHPVKSPVTGSAKLTLTDMWKKASSKKPKTEPKTNTEPELIVLDDEAPVARDPKSTTAPTSVKASAASKARNSSKPKGVHKPRKWSSKKVVVVRLGTIHASDGWFNNNYIFPVGYHAQTAFRSSIDLNEHVTHDCQIIGEGGQFWPKPTFRVTASDRPDEPLDGKSATACWTAVQKRINAEIESRRGKGEDLPPPPKTAIAGTEYFGFGNEGICGQIEVLDADKACTTYWEGKEAMREMNACKQVYGDQNNLIVRMMAQSGDVVGGNGGQAVSEDGESVITEDAEDVWEGEEVKFLEPKAVTVDDDAVKEMVSVMIEGVAAAMEAEDGDGDVVMREAADTVAAHVVAPPPESATPASALPASPAVPAVAVSHDKLDKPDIPAAQPSPLACAAAAADTVTTSTKKRRTFSFEAATVEAMEALYVKNSLPTKADKVKLAEEHGIEVKQIESWMGKRRKQDKDAAAGIVKTSKKKAKTSDGTGVLAVTQGEAADVDTTDAAGTVPATIQTPAAQNSEGKSRVPLPDDVLRARFGVTRAELEAEVVTLKTKGLFPPLVDLTTLVGSDPTPYSDDRLCYLAVGQSLTMTEFIATVSPMFVDATRPAEDAMRASMAVMLERKSADPVNKSIKAMDRLEWKNADGILGEGMWQWEAKNKENLDKDSGARAVAIKKRHAKVQERLRAIASVLSLTDSDVSAKIDKVDRVAAAFTKSSSMSVLIAEVENERKQEKFKEDFERLKADKKQEKERLKVEKEAEKERVKAEKEAEKQRLKAEKEAERQRIKAEKRAKKEQKKVASKTGFKDSKTLEKTANMFKSFLGVKKNTNKPPEAEAADTEAAYAAKDTRTYYERRFLKPTSSSEISVRAAPVQISLDPVLASTPSASAFGHDELVNEFRASMKAAGARYMAEQADLKIRCLGLPPSWARKADAIEVAEQTMQQLTSNGLTPDNIQTYRRKFIYVKDPYTVRPPFYGSKKPLEGNAFGPRHFFGKHPSLDYEIMSDEDWEEEPEGSSLSQDDAMSEDEADASNEDENSFCVGDGYLSADEGIKSDDDGVIAMDDADMCLIRSSKAEGAKGRRPDLAPYLEKSRRSGKPFVLVRDSVAAEANHGACYRGDTALCASLEMEILLPGARLEVPDLDEDKMRAAQTKDKKPKASTQAGAEDNADKMEKEKEKPTYDDLLPDLTAYILANAAATKPQLIDGFVARHSGRKLTKKWVDKSISALATRSGKAWKLKPATDTQGLPDGGVTPMCTIRAPMTVKPVATSVIDLLAKGEAEK